MNSRRVCVRDVVVVVEVGSAFFFFFFFKQKTAYEIGTGDWSSDVCSSDLREPLEPSVPIQKTIATTHF